MELTIKMEIMQKLKYLYIVLILGILVSACEEIKTVGEFDADETLMPAARTDAPFASSNLIASYDDYCDRVMLDWVPSVRTTSYDVYRDGILIGQDISDTTFTDMDAPSVDATYTVFSKNMNGSSDQYASAVGRRGEVPVSPITFSATDGAFEAKVDLTWDEVNFAKYYIIKRGATVLNDSVVGNAYADDVDAPTEATEYSIIAVGVCGQSDPVTDMGYCDPLLAFSVPLNENFEGFKLGALTAADFNSWMPRFQFNNAPNNDGDVIIKDDNTKYMDLKVKNGKSSIQLIFPEVDLLVGKSYTISFDIKAPQIVSLHMGVDLTGDGFMGKFVDDYFLPTTENTKNGNAFGINLGGTGEWKSYSFKFPMTGTATQDNDPDPEALGWTLGTIQEGQENPRIQFQMWSKNGTYAVDNIKIELIK